MICFNIRCIYNDEGTCTPEEIVVDENGACKTCICPEYPEKLLEFEKEKLRKEIETHDRFYLTGKKE